MKKLIAAALVATISVCVFLTPTSSVAKEAGSDASFTAADLNAIVSTAQNGFQGLAVLRNDNIGGADQTAYQVQQPLGLFHECVIFVSKHNPQAATLNCIVLTAGKNYGPTANTMWNQFKSLLRQTLSNGWSYSIPHFDNANTLDTLQATQSGSNTVVHTWIEYYDESDFSHIGQPTYNAFISVTSSNAHVGG